MSFLHHFNLFVHLLLAFELTKVFSLTPHIPQGVKSQFNKVERCMSEEIRLQFYKVTRGKQVIYDFEL